jgi:hypothetical protein
METRAVCMLGTWTRRRRRYDSNTFISTISVETIEARSNLHLISIITFFPYSMHILEFLV